jgi:hypothetical protein
MSSVSGFHFPILNTFGFVVFTFCGFAAWTSITWDAPPASFFIL